MSNKSNMDTIGGRGYSFGTIPAVEAVHVEIAIAKVIGEAAFKALMELDGGEKKSGKLSKERMLSIAAMAMGLLTTKMDADDLIKTMETVFKYVSCDGERIEINKTFTGRNKDLWLAFVAALRHNFSDFFPDSLSGSFQELMPK